MPRTYDKDPYKILGIPPNATASQIKQAYHRLARQYHPDLNKDARASERMKDINWAYDILSDPEKRSLHDLWQASRFQETARPETGYSHPGTTSPRSSYQRPVYSTGRVAQNPPAAGCSTTSVLIWLIVIVFMNTARLIKPAPQSVPLFLTVNPASKTALWATVKSAMGTFQASETPFPDFSPTTPIPPSSTSLRVSATATVLRDEFGHEDLRPKIVPGSQEWEWIHYYFPELTTTEGLSDEVTFVYWDQLRRAFIIETRQSGGYYISIFGGNLTAGRFSLESVTPTP